MSFKKIQIYILVFLFYYTLSYGGINDSIFKSGFEIEEIMCPLATPMTENNGNYEAFGAIEPIGEIDYYTFPVSNDQWLYISSDSAISLDTVVSLYSEDGTELLAQNDNNIITFNQDSLLIYKNINEVNLCLKVQDVSTAKIQSPQQINGSDFDYAVQVIPLDFSFDGMNEDIEPNDMLATAQTLSTFVYDQIEFQENAYVMSEFQSGSDVDNYLVSTPLNSVSARIVIPGNGVHGYGGTTQAQQLDIIEASSSNVLARINPSIGVREIWLPVQQSSDYYIQTSQPQIPRGDNPSYTLFWQTLSQQNQQETNNVANNNSAGAETPSSFPNGIYTSYFIGGTLAGAIDTDWWRFNANAGDIVNLYCDSWHTGSGVRNFTAQIYFNPMNPALQTGTESQTAGLVWANTTNATAPPVNITNSGVHYLMIHASLFANDVVGRHYQCGIHVQSP